MAGTVQPESGDTSAGLLLNLSSNNPFRNRAVSPSLQSPVSPFDDPPPRPVSRNPFLDPSVTRSLQNLRSPETMSSVAAPEKKSPTAEDLFDALTIDEQSAPLVKPGPPRPDGAKPPVVRRGPPPNRENLPPGARRGPPPGHRPSRSQEEAMRARRMQGGGQGSQDPNRSPQRRMDRRPRRNSDTSLMDCDKPAPTEEEKKEREARRREREKRHREAKDKKPNRKLDIIDQLDATSIFGTGLFHHDGPFDAVNPHRNRPGSRRAPMQAFPKDSLNNVIGGSGPLNARPDHATFLGNNDSEAFTDYSTGTKGRSGSTSLADSPIPRPKGDVPVFDPKSRGSILHGDETLGLGTSTFLEGTPAARTAIQKREEERAVEIMNEGLQRKKSLAQRIRNINRPPRGFEPSGRMTNPEGVYASRRSPSGSYMPTSANAGSERNPFFQEYETGKGEESISVRRTDNGNGAEHKSPPTSPRSSNGLTRRATHDAATNGPDDGGQTKLPGSGLLARVKSLKGGKRAKPTPPNVAQQGPPGQAV